MGTLSWGVLGLLVGRPAGQWHSQVAQQRLMQMQHLGLVQVVPVLVLAEDMQPVGWAAFKGR